MPFKLCKRRGLAFDVVYISCQTWSVIILRKHPEVRYYFYALLKPDDFGGKAHRGAR